MWPVMRKLKLDKFVDKDTVNQISNFTLEMIILAACATIQLDVVSKLFAPLFLHALISMTAVSYTHLIEAAVSFVETCRKTALITSIGGLKEAITGENGTRIIPD